MNVEEIFEEAILIAREAHAEQKRWSGLPYIVHPVRVALRVGRHYRKHKQVRSIPGIPSQAECKAAAVLHDVVEDSSVTINALRTAGFPSVILNAVCAITKEAGETYANYIDRVSRDPLATLVKMHDLIDNIHDNLKKGQRRDKYEVTLKHLQLVHSLRLTTCQKNQWACDQTDLDSWLLHEVYELAGIDKESK